MKLYIVQGAPNARKSQAVVNHLGLEPEIIRNDFFMGDMKQDNYMEINPNAKTPALVDGDLNLWESEAINIYLASEKAPEKGLFKPEHRPDILRWQFWSVSHYNRFLGTIAWQCIFKPVFDLGDRDNKIVSEAMEQFTPFMELLDNHLDGREFMVGDDWSIADYSIAMFESFVKNDAMPFVLSDYKNVLGFYERMSNNPYWKATEVEPEKIGRAA